jgi:large subunit ribosomal protein L22
VKECWVDPGPVIKRFQPKDRGKAYSIMKRTSHLVVTLDEREDKTEKSAAKPARKK